jgi:hypothetical protein
VTRQRGIARQHVLRRQAEAPHVFGREIAAAATGVFTHVAQDVRQLHRRTQRTGILNRLGAHRRAGRDAEHVGAHLANRTRHPFAILLELSPGVVRLGFEIASHPVEQLEQRIGRYVVGARYPRHLTKNRSGRPTVESRLQLLAIGIELNA